MASSTPLLECGSEFTSVMKNFTKSAYPCRQYSGLNLAQPSGTGLLTGVELVRDGTAQPDDTLASDVKNGMRASGVLIGSTGPHDNVLKVRPPLVFGDEHIPVVVEALDATLRSLGR